MTAVTPEFISPETEDKPKKKIVRKTAVPAKSVKKVAPAKPAAKKTSPPARKKETKATRVAMEKAVAAKDEKKAPAKKTAAKKTATKAPAAKKATATKAVAKKVPAKKTAAATSGTKQTQKAWGDFNIHGYRVGTDSAIIVDELIKGGKGRTEVTERIAKKLPSTETRGGQSKNIPSLISGLLARLEEGGYKVEQSWVVVPPAAIARKMANAQVTKAKKVVAKAKG